MAEVVAQASPVATAVVVPKVVAPSVGAFADLFAPSDALIRRSFPEPRAFEIATKTTANAIGVKTAFVKDGAGVFSQVGLDVKFEGAKVDISCQMTTRGECKASLTANGLGVAGTKVSLATDTNESGLTFVNGDLGFANEHANAKLGAKFSVERSKVDSVSFNVVGTFPKKLYHGISVNKDFQKDTLTVETGSAWQCCDSKAAVKFTKDDALRAHFSWWQSISNDVKFASLVAFDVLPEKGKGVTAQVGATWKVDNDTSFKGKWNVVSKPGSPATFRAGLAAEQRINKNAVATVGLDLNASKFLGRKDAGDADHTFGFKVAFE